MDRAYLLQHTYEVDEVAETKIIGIYSTRAAVMEVAEHYMTLPGFRDYQDGFHIDDYQIDKNYWEEGFLTV